MKRILITGADSYIGTSFETYLQRFPEQYQVDTVDMLDKTWRERSFAGYDTVFHVAGIAHRKESKENAHLYYEVNRDLTEEVCRKAKQDGVGQFIFLSSMSVYGMDTGVITKQTPPAPRTHYGTSKWQAEQAIAPLQDEHFKICVLRPPMVYGDGCKGNYQTIIKIVEKLPVFPRVNNQRSSIHIDNLCAFVKLAVDRTLEGLYFPQNRTFVNTKDLAQHIAQARGKRIYFSFLCGFAVLLCRPFFSVLRKAFGNLVYENTEDFEFEYCEKTL